MNAAILVENATRHVTATRAPRGRHSRAEHRSPRTILDDVSFAVRENEITALLGPNGAGKSTTIELIAGLERPSSGEVRVFGLDPYHSRREITRLVGVQPQSGALPPFLTVDETLHLFAALRHDSSNTDGLRGRLGLDAARNTRVKHLSGGQRRRLLIGAALLGRPRLLVLDEPGAGLDPAMRREVDDLILEIRAEGTTVLLTTHHLDEAEFLCDQVVILAGGRVVTAGSPADLTRDLARDAEVSFTVGSDVDEGRLRDVIGGDWHARPIPGGERISVFTSDVDTLLRRLTFARDLSATGISVHQPTLEDAYLAVTS
ncbi:ABC transporter ATP-binding protein [Microbacterium gorillae]|uniref:ABC transporter ATP-binding protein n=1 Tax=Microbacterium gorillae TaxID=1231063 RepID=UPI003D970231